MIFDGDHEDEPLWEENVVVWGYNKIPYSSLDGEYACDRYRLLRVVTFG